MPRAEESHYPFIGVAALILTIVLAIVGGFLAQAFFVFVTFAAVACFLWACASGLSAASGQGVMSALSLVPALIATVVFYYALVVPNPTVKGVLAALIVAAFCYAAFFFEKKRGERYRRPIAIGTLSTFLVLSFAVCLNVARYNIGRGVTEKPVDQADMAVPPQAPDRPIPRQTNRARQDVDQAHVAVPPQAADRPIARQTNRAPQDIVDWALRQKRTLTEGRSGFRAKPVPQAATREPLDEPPRNLFKTVRYDSSVGKLAAYITPAPPDGRRHPAMIWITGGDCNTIGDVWTPRDRANDQSASAYRRAGIVMMFPSLRGGNENPGQKEAFLGEVDDVLAAADFLSSQDYVDPDRIYLGGHSTGGTLVLLVAESSARFRAVISFGPVNDVRGYGPQYAAVRHASDLREAAVRSPGYWLHSVQSPTFVFEGEKGNIAPLRSMQRDAKNPLIHFHAVTGADHFTVLAPTNQIIASKIIGDTGTSTNLEFTPNELNQPFGR